MRSVPQAVGKPAAIERLDLLLGTSRIAHEAIYEMAREQAERGSKGAEGDRLLEESARITTRELPETTRRARDLAKEWHEQIVLTPNTGVVTLRDFETELQQVEPVLLGHLERQRQIAANMRSRLARSS